MRRLICQGNKKKDALNSCVRRNSINQWGKCVLYDDTDYWSNIVLSLSFQPQKEEHRIIHPSCRRCRRLKAEKRAEGSFRDRDENKDDDEVGSWLSSQCYACSSRAAVQSK
jgi:hypothetical protein